MFMCDIIPKIAEGPEKHTVVYVLVSLELMKFHIHIAQY